MMEREREYRDSTRPRTQKASDINTFIVTIAIAMLIIMFPSVACIVATSCHITITDTNICTHELP